VGDPIKRQLVQQSGEIKRLTAQVEAIKALVNEQAEDYGLWFIAQTAPEAYLQKELRRLHEVIERD
jgi:hypothetical protein